ncbi:MAG: NAD-dependent deacylase [Bacteroidetes bacterium]|nr:NAD-dependent deacylase [Bacteroidota bacterium]
MKKLVVLTGAGISAESGISTFRDSDGLWENHRIEDVASPVGWERDPETVMKFYNLRRKQLFEVHPNEGHKALAQLEDHFDVQIITQNIDDLHERAGSSNVIHLHGELKKVRSCVHPELVYTLDHWELKMGDVCERGHQLRPHIVWFGEAVPMIGIAADITEQADIFMVVGTSMAVYPAAGLIGFVKRDIPKYYIDPKAFHLPGILNLKVVKEKAGVGVPRLAKELLKIK